METRLMPYQASLMIECDAALVFAPHPDDEALGCGGLLLAYKSAGIPVTAVIVTSGDHGEHGQAGVEVREQESREAARQLGIANLIFWREPDRGVAYNERTVAAARQAILDCGADLIIAPSTSEIHPDHRATAWIAIEAARRLVLEGKPLRVAQYEVGTPLPRVNLLVDITAHEAAKKNAASCYGSQLAIQRYDELLLALNRFRSYTLPTQVRFAEAYRLLQAEELLQPTLIAEPELHRQERLNLVTSRSQQEKVSVLIRSMDRPTLSHTLDSVALQTWPNIEVIVLNAKGAEHSPLPDLVGAFPLRFVDSAQNIPRAQAANLLLETADSELALFLDDDDWLAPDHVVHLVEQLRANPKIAAAFSGVEFGQLVKDVDAQEHWQVTHRFNATYDPFRLLFENYLPIHSVLFRLSLVRDDWACRFDTSMDVFEDWDFWLQISQHAGLVGTGHVSAFYNHNTDDGSGVFSAADANRPLVLKLREKWFSRLAPTNFSQLLDYAQDLYRDLSESKAYATALIAHHEDSQRALQGATREQVDGLTAMLRSRDNEIVNHQAHTRGLQEILAAKQAEITRIIVDANAALDQLRAAKDAEIARVLAAKAAEITQICAARDSDIAAIRGSLEELQAATRNRRWLLGKLLTQK